jgi:uncharacterized protein (TIGR02466 family)
MEFENFELFPKVVTIYKYDKEKIERIKEICNDVQERIKEGDKEFNVNFVDNSLKHYYNDSWSSLLHEEKELEEFRIWVEECAKHFMTQVLDYEIDEDIPVITTDSWLNVCGERTTQVKHNHNNCIVSGTYYVDRQEWVHAGIEFYRPHIELQPALSQKRPRDDNSNKYTRYIETLYPSSGDLLLWSSEMIHGYNGITNFWEGRTSISMNFLPQVIDNGKYSFTIKENGERI